MRISSGIGFLILGSALATVACQASLEVKTKSRFVNSPDTTREIDWAGEAIDLNSDSVGAAINGGVEVIAEPGRTKIEASARVTALAFSEDKAAADLSIQEAIATIQLVKSGDTIQFRCGHGGSHESSLSGDSGCEKVTIRIPAGTAQEPITLKVGAGNGDLNVSGAPFTNDVTVDSNGAGDVDVAVSPQKGASVIITSEGAATVRLPADFAAENVILAVNESDPVDAKARIDVSAFDGMEADKPFGPQDNAVKVLSVESKSLLDSNKVTVTKQ